MRSLRLVLPLLVLVALALSACQPNAEPAAAHVNGSLISTSDLNSATVSGASDSGYRCYVESQSDSSGATDGQSIGGVGSGTYASSFVARQLDLLIESLVLRQGADERHLSLTSIARSVASEQLATDLSSSGSGCTASGASTLAALSPSFRTSFLGYLAAQDVLAAHLVGVELSSSSLAAYARAHPAVSSLDCTSAIVTSTSAKAASLAGQLRAGANFAVVAKANSLDTTSAANGGALGCLSPTEFTAPLDTIIEHLGVGKISAPVSFDGEWVILKVTSRSPAPADDVAQAIVGSEVQAKGYSTLVNDLIGKAHVVVDPTYGTWVETNGTYGVQPPSGPAVDLVPNLVAVTPGVPQP